VIERQALPAEIECGHLTATHELYLALLVGGARVERKLLLLGRSGQVVFGQTRPVIGRLLVAIDKRDGSLEPELAQLVRGAVPCGSGTYDCDRSRRRRPRPRPASHAARLRPLPGDEHLAGALYGLVAGDRAQGRSAQRLTGPQAEAGVVPGA